MRRATAFVVLLGAMMTPVIAHAQPSENAVAAEALFDAGRADVEKGDFANACPKFLQSHKLDPAAGTLINLADCEEHVGHLAAAWLAWREAVERLPLGDPRLPTVTQRRDAMEKRVPRLTIRLGRVESSDFVVTKDEAALPKDLLDVPLPVDPGRHVIVFKTPQHLESRTIVSLGEGARETITLEPGPPEATRERIDPIRPTEPEGGGVPWYGWGALGLGVVGVGLGTVTGILAISKKGEQEENCFPITTCTDAGADAASSGRTFATVSTVSVIVGSAALLAGLYFVLTAPSAPRKAAR